MSVGEQTTGDASFGDEYWHSVGEGEPVAPNEATNDPDDLTFILDQDTLAKLYENKGYSPGAAKIEAVRMMSLNEDGAMLVPPQTQNI
jgi:hypothetical protein